MRQIAPRAEARLRGRFAAHRIAYPPERIDILAFKHSRRVEVRAWSHGRAGVAASYRMLDSSGGPGPKLHEGDEQIPEGVYAVTLLNPNSDYDVSLKLDYPNRFDRSHARRDGRRNLGGQIFIHGDDVSIGCLAVGNAAAEELFVLVDRVGLDNVRVIIAPWDFRQVPPPRVAPPGQPRWLPELYARIDRVLREGSG